MSTCNCNATPCCCKPLPPACNCPPSPIPPWDRPVQSPLTQTLADGTLPMVLDPDVTYLRAALPGDPININLPSGNFKRQMKRIYVPGDIAATTRTWVVAGTYSSGYATLTFNSLATSALLEWDGAGWQLVGGNAAPP